MADNETHSWFPADVPPPPEETVLMFTKWGSIWTGTYRDKGASGCMFSTDALKLGKDVLWWMPIPVDGWHKVADEKPPLDTWTLVKEQYGKVRSAKWCFKFSWSKEPSFCPFVGDRPCYWREMPPLPPGVTLKELKRWGN